MRADHAWSLLLVAGILIGVAGCAESVGLPRDRPVPLTLRGRSLLQEYLPALAKGHRDKMQLAFFAQFKGLSGPVAAFNSQMGRQQSQLLAQLQSWAGRRHISLGYRYPRTLHGAALRIESNRDEHVLLSAGGGNFQHMYLVLMYNDFTAQAALDEALEHADVAGGPQAYLAKALAVNRASAGRIVKLLAHFDWETK